MSRMANVRRDVVYPRAVQPPGFPKPVDLKPWVSHLEKRLKEFRSAGLPVPYVWRHDDDAFPGSKAEKLLAGDGRLQLGEVDTEEIDGDGILVANLEVPNADDHKQLKACRHVSPWIKWNWQDGTGKVWPGPSILHVAVAPRPVQPTRDFKLSHDGLPEELFLSLSDYERGEEMADEPKKPEGGSKKPKDGFDKDILECLAMANIVLPDDTTEQTFWDRLRTACHTLNAANGGGKKPAEEPKPVENPEAPMGLSHDQQQQLELGGRAIKALLKERMEKTRGRIDRLQKTCRISGEIAKAMFATLDAPSLKLSLDANGDLERNDLLVEIAAYEKMPEGAATGGVRLAHGETPTAEQPPSEGVMDGSKINPTVVERLARRPYKPQPN